MLPSGDEPRSDLDASHEADTRAGLLAAHEAEQNLLLRSFPLEEYDRVLLDLRPVRLNFKHVVIEPDTPIRDVYFIRDGVASVIATLQDGGDIEVGTIGREGFVGLPLLHAADTMSQRVLIQVEGDAWRMSAEAFRRMIEQRPAVLPTLLRFAQYYLEQVSQSVACNRLHTVEERCARWLLMTDDRVSSEQFELTHEFIAQMLGVRRAGVTVALGVLQRARIIRSVRGRIAILDRSRLEAASCDCYRITREMQRRLIRSA